MNPDVTLKTIDEKLLEHAMIVVAGVLITRVDSYTADELIALVDTIIDLVIVYRS